MGVGALEAKKDGWDDIGMSGGGAAGSFELLPCCDCLQCSLH